MFKYLCFNRVKLFKVCIGIVNREGYVVFLRYVVVSYNFIDCFKYCRSCSSINILSYFYI